MRNSRKKKREVVEVQIKPQDDLLGEHPSVLLKMYDVLVNLGDLRWPMKFSSFEYNLDKQVKF